MKKNQNKIKLEKVISLVQSHKVNIPRANRTFYQIEKFGKYVLKKLRQLINSLVNENYTRLQKIYVLV